MSNPILTDGATFSCPHGGTGTITSGISVSAVAVKVTIGGAHPILAGATIAGFTPASGCAWQVSGVPTPCVGFMLPPPAGMAVAIGGQPVYTSADAATIAFAPSTGNGIPGLQISESQTKALA